MPRPALAGTPAPRRRARTRRVGQSTDYVEDEDAPTAAQVVALSEALEQLVGPWGRLAPEVAANCGPRWGEQFQLTADDTHPDGCTITDQPHLHIDWQIDSGARAGDLGGRRCPPKGDKTRIAPLPADPGVLMALGGWENEATVLNRYYRTGTEHTLRGLAQFSQVPEAG